MRAYGASSHKLERQSSMSRRLRERGHVSGGSAEHAQPGVTPADPGESPVLAVMQRVDTTALMKGMASRRGPFRSGLGQDCRTDGRNHVIVRGRTSSSRA